MSIFSWVSATKLDGHCSGPQVVCFTYLCLFVHLEDITGHTKQAGCVIIGLHAEKILSNLDKGCDLGRTGPDQDRCPLPEFLHTY